MIAKLYAFLNALWLAAGVYINKITNSIAATIDAAWRSPMMLEIRGALSVKWLNAYAKVSAALLAALVTIQTAAAQSLTIDLDISQLFTQINNFLPVGIAIFAVPVGIVVAFTLIRFVANALIKAFNGQQL